MENNHFFAVLNDEKGFKSQASMGANLSISKTPKTKGMDEEFVRVGANIIFTIFAIIGAAWLIAGIALLFKGGFGFGFGILCIPLGALVIVCGWITRAMIRLFANMSERLTNIDKKVKEP